MERSDIRDKLSRNRTPAPDYAALHPGYALPPHNAMSVTCFAFCTQAPIRKARSVPVDT